MRPSEKWKDKRKVDFLSFSWYYYKVKKNKILVSKNASSTRCKLYTKSATSNNNGAKDSPQEE